MLNSKNAINICNKLHTEVVAGTTDILSTISPLTLQLGVVNKSVLCPPS